MKTPLLGRDGEPIALQGIFWNVTERRSNHALRTGSSEKAASRHQAWRPSV